ncbi:MAG TPA: TMEM175 family protein [Polyangiaceae bacterium]
MRTGRLEAFSDGVLAILITIMVLELKVPHGADWEALQHLFPALCAYVLSFIYIGIYWNNHHHMLHACDRATGGILWANLHLLFWLSLVPAATDWMGEHHLAPLPTAIYGGILLAAGIAYVILQNAIIRSQGQNSKLRSLLGKDMKGKLSPILYLLGIGTAFVHTAVSQTIYACVAAMWLIPDRRIEGRIVEG